MRTIVVGCICLTLGLGASAASAAPGDPGFAFSSDSDCDGNKDADDTCPSGHDASTTYATCSGGTVAKKPSVPSPDPLCYDIVFADTTATGTFNWPSGTIPALTYPVRDDSGAHLLRGVVAVGRRILDPSVPAPADTKPSWPRNRSARWIASLDYAEGHIRLVEGEQLAYEYATRVVDPSGPGFGLITGGSFEVATRDGREPVLQVMPFNRGLLVAEDLSSEFGRFVVDAVGHELFCDPTKSGGCLDTDDSMLPKRTAGTVRRVSSAIELAPELASYPPADWRFIPKKMLDALQADADGAAAAFGTSARIEGLPPALFCQADGTCPGSLPGANSLLLVNRGLLYRNAPGTKGSAEWTVVPSRITRTAQHLFGSQGSVAVMQPAGSASYAALGGGRALAMQRVLVSKAFPLPGETWGRSIEVVGTDLAEHPAIAVSERSMSFGTRWATNAGDGACWAGYAPLSSGSVRDVLGVDHFLPFPQANEGGTEPDVIAKAWCPQSLFDWWRTTPAVNTLGGAKATCAPATHGLQLVQNSTLAAASLGDLNECSSSDLARLQTAIDSCRVDPQQAEGVPNWDRVQCLAQNLSDTGDDALLTCLVRSIARLHNDHLPNDVHWVDISRGRELVPVVGLMRGEGREGIVSRMTSEDSVFCNAHQGTDWNWIAKDATALDPMYRAIGVHDGLRFTGVDVEMEFQIAMGLWGDAADRTDCAPYRPDGKKPFVSLGLPLQPAPSVCHRRLSFPQRASLHGQSLGYYFGKLLENKTSDVEYVGMIWPSQFCGAVGIDRSKRADDACGARMYAAPSFPVKSCGLTHDDGTPLTVTPTSGGECAKVVDVDATSSSVTACVLARPPRDICGGGDEESPENAVDGGEDKNFGKDVDYWRQHYGRGLFAPLVRETVDPASNASKMALDRSFAGGGSPGRSVGLGLTDWDEYPHRIGFLGQPIIDCGHFDESTCETRVEIHPPHIITMDVGDAVCADGTPGVLAAAFGWTNETIDGHLEFDLWPPARPSAAASLSWTLPLPCGDGMSPSPVDGFGCAVDDACDQRDVGKPSLSCVPSPAMQPNHLHCTYVDPAAFSRGDLDFRLQNPRMVPGYATSRFEVRACLGWRE